MQSNEIVQLGSNWCSDIRIYRTIYPPPFFWFLNPPHLMIQFLYATCPVQRKMDYSTNTFCMRFALGFETNNIFLVRKHHPKRYHELQQIKGQKYGSINESISWRKECPVGTPLKRYLFS